MQSDGAAGAKRRIRREKGKRKETLFERGREEEREEMRERLAGRGNEDRAQRGRLECAFGERRRGKRKRIFGERQEERRKCGL